MKKTTITIEEFSENVWLLEIIAEKTMYCNGSREHRVYHKLSDAMADMKKSMCRYMRNTESMFGDSYFFLDSQLAHVSIYDSDYSVACDEDGLMMHIHAHIYKQEIL